MSTALLLLEFQNDYFPMDGHRWKKARKPAQKLAKC